MGDAEFTVPKAKNADGWHEIPKWLMDAGAIPYPRKKWTLPDGTIVDPGQTIAMVDGALSVKQEGLL